jgi:sugar/nucleoside kinase (ribokinase family)
MAVDVLGIGCCAVDDVLFVAAYPNADTKVEVRRRERRCGGLTAIALMAAARLGASCHFAGALGDDELSRFVLGAIRDSGVDTSTAVIRPDARPVHSMIVVDESTRSRTIFYDPHNVFAADPELPPAELIRAAKVLFIDHYGITGQIRASRIAREADIPVVADLEDHETPRFGELLELVDHLILSHESAARITGQ